MHSSTSRRSHQDYTVAWITALPLELSAGKEMFDENHSELPQPFTDTNSYSLGSVCGHNVVMACLPVGVMGTTSAATVVAHLRSTFPSIQFGLLVGIGGGVPTQGNDIRLGDIVVSKPAATYGGVVQYDYGKAIDDGHFEQMGVLNKPPEILLTSISTLQANYRREEMPVSSILSQRCISSDKFAHPGGHNDQLFKATYRHKDTKATCEKCDQQNVIHRGQRDSAEPMIHYGLIASGNQVMRDAMTRDNLAEKHGIVCFEMEAAGLMSQLPCLVIRGICDYADSHKNKMWQGYAAMTAAAFARLLLSAVPRSSIPRSSEPKDELWETEKRCLQRLFLTDPETDMNALKRKKGGRAPGTCEWILGTDEVKRWIRAEPASAMDRSNILWLYGYPGIGKSTMAITLAETIPDEPSFRDGNKVLVYFFCDSNSEDRRTATAILRGLLYQISKKSRKLIRPLRMKHDIQGDKLFNSFDALWDLLMETGRDHDGEIYCIIDALDECDYTAQETLLTQISESFLSKKNSPGVHILITSRPFEEIRRYLGDFPNNDLGAYDNVQGDLDVFINQRVTELGRKNNYPESLKDEVIAILKEKVERTFLWVGIACDELTHVRLRDTVKTLQELPHSLDSLYQNLLDKALGQNRDDQDTIIRILGCVVTARRPLTILELSEACQLYVDMDYEVRLAYVREDINMCRLLVVLQGSIVSLLHKSLRDFLTRSQHRRVLDERSAHAGFAYSCIDRLFEASRKGELEVTMAYTSSFLQYSAENWPLHAHLAENQFSVQERHKPFFELRSEIREQWLEYIRFPIPNSNHPKIPYNLSIYHVAARWGIPCLIPYAQLQHNKTSENSAMTRPVHVEALFSGGRTPLEDSASAGHVEVFQLLLDQAHGKITKEAAVVQAATRNKQGGRQIIEMLLDRQESDIQINEEVVVQAMRNENKEIVEFLIQRLGPKLPVTERVIMELARNRQNAPEVLKLFLRKLGQSFYLRQNVFGIVATHGNATLMTILLDELGSRSSITPDVLATIISNIENGLEILSLLVSRYGKSLPVPPVRNLFDNWDAREKLWHYNNDLFLDFMALLRLLLDQLGCKLPSLDNLLPKLIRSHSSYGGEVLHLLLQHRPNEVTITPDFLEASFNTRHKGLMKLVLSKDIMHLVDEKVLEMLARRGSQSLMQSLLIRLEDDSLITASVIENSALNPGDGPSILRLLGSRLGDRLPVTELALRHVVLNKALGQIMLGWLLDQLPDKLPVSPDIFETAALNKAIGPELVYRLVQSFGDIVPCSVRVIEAAAKGKDGGGAVIDALLMQVENGFLDMDNLMINVASAGCARLMVRVLDQAKDPQTAISEDVILAAAHSQDEEIIDLLLNHAGRLILNGDILAAAGQGVKKGNEILQKLLTHPKCEVHMTQEVLHTILYSTLSEEVNVGLLLAHKGELSVTNGIFKAIIDHGSHQLLSILLDCLDEAQSIPEEVLEQVVRNYFGQRKLFLLLERCRCNLEFTEVVLEAAACNYYSGRENITMLLDRLQANELPITTEAIASLLKRSEGDSSLGLLLFERFQEKFRLTPDFPKAIVGFGDPQLVSLLINEKYDIPITSEIFQAAADNHKYGRQVLQLLFALNRNQAFITEEILETAAGNRNTDILCFLLDHCSDNRMITPSVLAAAARTTPRAIKTLLNRDFDDNIITEEVLISALQNYSHGDHIIKLLHGRLAGHMPITERVLIASAFSYRHAASLTRLLLQWSGDINLVTESVVKSAVRNPMSGHNVLKLLFGLYGNSIPITEEVLETAATNFEGGHRIIQLILDQRPDVPITEKVVMKVVSGDRDTRTIKLLLAKRDNNIPITESVLIAAIGNTSYSHDFISLFVKTRKQSVHDCLTEKLLSTTAASGEYRILRLFEKNFAVSVTQELLLIGRLYRAARESNDPVVSELIAQGIPLDTRNARGETPLWHAASRNHQSVVRKLLQTGLVDVNAVSDSGDSALIIAARTGYTNTVRLLLEYGADPGIANENENTAYSMAKQRSFFGTMKVLDRYCGQKS